VKIYTKTGDGGQTSLFGGKRTDKDALRIEAYGTVDELNAQLGAIRSLELTSEVGALIERLQHELFALGADLATPPTEDSDHVKRMGDAEIAGLEREIDLIEAVLPRLNAFILPGGTPAGAQLHVARTVCRRAERLVVRLIREESLSKSPAIYLNRLSDLLFVLARHVNQTARSPEKPWMP